MAKIKMLKKTKYNHSSGNVNMKLDLSRFEQQYKDAQFTLDSKVMEDMQPYMPMQTGTFINVTKAMSAALAGSGMVCAGAPPMGRFLYEGKVMVDPETNSPWARKGAKKVVTERDLQYNKNAHPKATDHWFDEAKKQHEEEWITLTKKIAGGGA